MQYSPRFQTFVDDIKRQVQHIEAEELAALLEANSNACFLIDVREKEEFDQGHLANALHLSKGVLEWQIEKHVNNPNAPIVLYCGGGGRSSVAAFNLQKMGFTEVKSLVGGYKGWVAKGLPTV